MKKGLLYYWKRIPKIGKISFIAVLLIIFTILAVNWKNGAEYFGKPFPFHNTYDGWKFDKNFWLY